MESNVPGSQEFRAETQKARTSQYLEELQLARENLVVLLVDVLGVMATALMGTGSGAPVSSGMGKMCPDMWTMPGLTERGPKVPCR